MSTDVLTGTLLLLVMLVGLAGIIIPVLPGLGLINAAVLVWALLEQSPYGWVALAVCLLLWGTAFLLQYLVPGKRLVDAGVPTWVIVVAGLAGVVGFFVIPVLGLPLFFVGTIYLVQSLRAKHLGRSVASTWQAVIAVGISQLIELTGGMLCVATYVIAWTLASR
ncbi:DUF456 domain-containing protein [Aquipuribacter sp. MA13-6]|uniref:DUF456 domain-containing protein n=1 Tax=unclassified Aquipuribacter TaxID=2635084 RepID=UPI003EE8705B